MTRRFFTLDVFTETPLAGNPLAVVLDAEGLDDCSASIGGSAVIVSSGALDL